MLYLFYIFAYCFSILYPMRLDCIHFTFLFLHVCFQTKLFTLYNTTGGWTVSILHLFFFRIGAFKPSCLPCISPFCKSLSLCMARLIADQSLKRNEKMRSNQFQNLIRLEVIGFLSLGFCLGTIYRLCHDFFELFLLVVQW